MNSLRILPRASFLVLLVLAAAWPGRASAQECFDYAECLRVTGSLATSEPVMDVIADGSFGLVIYDGYAHTAPSVLDISDPQNPTIGGSLDAPLTTVLDVSLSNGLAYIATYDWLYLASLMPPSNPAILGAVETPGRALGVASSGHYAFVADETSLTVVDFFVPSAPLVMACLPIPGCTDIAVIGEYAYLGGDDFRVVDISNPLVPVLVNELGNAQSVDEIILSGDSLYFSDSEGLKLMDISNPANPVVISCLVFPDTFSDFFVHFKVNNDRALVITYDYFPPSGPGEPGGYGDPEIFLYDLSDPLAPSFVGKMWLPEVAWNGTFLGDSGYMACSDGITILAGITSGSPLVGANRHFWNYMNDIAYSDGKVFLAMGFNGLGILDVNDPTQPFPLGSLDTQKALDVEVSGDYAFISDEDGFLVVDVHDPAAPELAAQIGSVDSYFKAVALDGNYAFVCGSIDGFLVVDITDPETPVTVGTLGALTANWLTVSGSYVYTGNDYSGGFWIVDVSDPSIPNIVGGIATLYPNHLCLVDDLAYIHDDDDGLVIVDVSDPMSPEVVASPGWHMRIAYPVTNPYAYGLSGEGIHVLDISNPLAPVRLGTWGDEGDLSVAVIDNSLIYCGRGLAGLKIFMPQCPSAVPVYWEPGNVQACSSSLMDIHPNPFNPRTVISFNVERPAPVKITVYDLAGRQVQVLVDRPYQEGTFEVEWRGRDKTGRPVSSGTYMLRAKVGDLVQTKKATVVR